MFESYFSNGRQWFKCTTCGQSGLSKGVAYAHEQTCAAAASTEGHSSTSESQTSSGDGFTDDEGAVFPRSSEAGTSMNVDSSDARDHSMDSSADSDEASTGESDTQPESNAADDPRFGADEEPHSNQPGGMAAPSVASKAATNERERSASPGDSWEVEAQLLLQEVDDDQASNSDSDCESDYSAYEAEVGDLAQI